MIQPPSCITACCHFYKHLGSVHTSRLQSCTILSAALDSNFDTTLRWLWYNFFHCLALKLCQSQIKEVQEPFLKSQHNLSSVNWNSWTLERQLEHHRDAWHFACPATLGLACQILSRTSVNRALCLAWLRFQGYAYVEWSGFQEPLISGRSRNSNMNKYFLSFVKIESQNFQVARQLC